MYDEGLKKWQEDNRCFECRFCDKEAKPGEPCCAYIGHIEIDDSGYCLEADIVGKE